VQLLQATVRVHQQLTTAGHLTVQQRFNIENTIRTLSDYGELNQILFYSYYIYYIYSITFLLLLPFNICKICRGIKELMVSYLQSL